MSNGLALRLQGSVITHPLPANKMSTSTTLKFQQLKGKQIPEKFESGLRDVLEFNVNGGPFEQSGFAWSTSKSNEEPIEINTVV